MSKNKKEHRISERKKYLKTLMADMGLADIRSLPKEEAERWQRAAEPQKVVQRKLKEMGYSLNSDNNKRSLGRVSRLLQIKRAAELNPDIKKLQDILGLDAYREVVPTILPIFSMMGSFSKKKYIKESLTAIENINPDAASDPEVKKALKGLSSSLFKTLSFNKDIGKIIYEDPNASLKIDDLSDKNKKTIIALLAGEKFLDPSSPSDYDIIRALKDFQEANGLTPSGEVDSRTYSRMIQGSDGSINSPEKSVDNEKSKASEIEALSEVSQNLNSGSLYSALFSYLKNRNLCIAMVANAIHESRLQPGIAGDCGSYAEERSDRSINIKSKGLCCSYGLWQYNICTRTSMGTRFLRYYGAESGTDEERLALLTDASKQIEYMVYYLQANYSGEIKEEKSVEEWTEWFVINIENPADHGGAISKRIPTAQDLARSIPNDQSGSRIS